MERDSAEGPGDEWGWGGGEVDERDLGRGAFGVECEYSDLSVFEGAVFCPAL